MGLPKGKGRTSFFWTDSLFVYCIAKALFPVNKQWPGSQFIMWLNVFVNPLVLAALFHYGLHIPSFWLTFLAIFLTFYVVALVIELLRWK
jgi:hypothetical protein